MLLVSGGSENHKKIVIGFGTIMGATTELAHIYIVLRTL
jgi:hypothetical protein